MLADDRDHRLVIHLRVIQAIEQVNRAGSGCRDAHPHLAGELRMGTRHQAGDLLVGGTDVTEVLAVALGSSQRPVKSADAIPGVAVEAVQIPLDQAIDNEVADCAHDRSFPLSAETLRWRPAPSLTRATL